MKIKGLARSTAVDLCMPNVREAGEVLGLVEIDGVVHEVEFDDTAVVLRCDGSTFNEFPWNPYHPANAGKPMRVGCLGCIALGDRKD